MLLYVCTNYFFFPVKPPSPDLHPEVKADPVPPLSMEIVKPEQFIETANHINQTESDIFVKTEKDSISVVDSHKYQKQAMVWTHNTRLRHVLYKEIKRPGRSKSLVDIQYHYACINWVHL